jgi:UDP-N-acetylmuramoylalanine-D-glutamate ligase
LSLIAGGHVRGTDFKALARALDSRSRKSATSLVYLGEAGERLARELDDIASAIDRSKAASVADAVAMATEHVSASGGVVLLSPAAPTPRAEGTYVERSAEFRRAVEERVTRPC